MSDGSVASLGQLVPIAGGDPIPLVKSQIIVGRRPDCDILLNQPNVSGKHCEMKFVDGWWTIRDLASSNGVKVNGVKVEENERKRLTPGDEISIARRHQYRIEFETSAKAPEQVVEDIEEEKSIFSKSLLERAGLAKKNRPIVFDSDLFDEKAPPG